MVTLSIAEEIADLDKAFLWRSDLHLFDVGQAKFSVYTPGARFKGDCFDFAVFDR